MRATALGGARPSPFHSRSCVRLEGVGDRISHPGRAKWRAPKRGQIFFYQYFSTGDLRYHAFASDTAKREFHEETCNAFSDVDMSKLHMLMETQTPSGQKFFLYGLPFPCRYSLDDFYRNRSKTHAKTHLEKKRLRWFHINHLPRLRPCFGNDIHAILQTLNHCRAKTATNSMCITYAHVPDVY